MNSQAPPIFWHWAVSRAHQQVAVAAFLKTVTEAHFMVYYASCDSKAQLLADAAHFLNLSIYPIQECTRDSLLAIRGNWAWIGTEKNAGCQRFITLPTPPRIVLCLSSFEIQPHPAIPDMHAFYVTNMPMDVRGRHDRLRILSQKQA